jgi:Uma2 family endonuclease
MESHVHMMQIVLLLTGLHWAWRDRKNFFASANMSVFYPVITAAGNKVTRKLKFRGPDFFVALDVRNEPLRRSWVVENEGKYPDVIVEVLSSRTKNADRGRKKEIYEQTFCTYEYFLFEPKTDTLEGFRLVDGRYAAIKPNLHGHLWSEKLGMAIGLHHEPAMLGKVARYFNADGIMMAIPQEDAINAQRATNKALEEANEARTEANEARTEANEARTEANEARTEANEARTEANEARTEANEARATAAQAMTQARQAEAKAARLADKLRALGLDPDKLP